MSLLENDIVLTSHYSQIDNAHLEFITLMNAMAIANNTEFSALFSQLMQHTQAHFEEEYALMQQSSFPAIKEHHGEHQRILGELTQFKKRLDKGLISFARSYIHESLPAWFKLHISTMDSALIAHLNKINSVSNN